MQIQKKTLSAAILGVLGVAAVVQSASAVQLVADGDYKLVILTTPSQPVGTAGATVYNFGSDTKWRSSFTFGGTAPNASSQGMSDNGTTITQNGGPRGSSLNGDGYAGVLTLHVTGGAFTVTSFSKDTIFGTAGGDFVQYTDPSTTTAPQTVGVSSMSGTIDQATGAMTLDPTGRMGAVSSFPSLFDERWNVNNCTATNGNCAPNSNTAYGIFSTGSATTPLALPPVTINGKALASIGDTNADGVTDFSVIMVSGGTIGSDWGGFFGAQYFEVWNAQLISDAASTPVVAASYSINTTQGSAVTTDVVADGGSTGVAPLTIQSVSGTDANGTCAQGAGATQVTFTPDVAFSGQHTCGYVLQGGNSQTGSGTITINVSVTGIPVANNDAASTNQDTAVTVNVTANDTDAEDPGGIPGGTVTVVTNTTRCVVSGQNVVYTPTTGYVGSDSCVYTVDDLNSNTSNQATISLTVKSAPLVSTGGGTFGPGSLATSVGTTTALQLGRIDDSSLVPSDAGYTSSCDGGCFDFTLTGVTISPAVVVLPLSGAIAAQDVADGMVYRKYKNGAWVNFDISTGDEVASAPATAGGGCPTAGDVSWTPWTDGTDPVAAGANVGDTCLRLTIADDGPNDSNGTPGAIADPSGAASGAVTAPSTSPSLNNFSSNGGCSLTTQRVEPMQRADWWIVGSVLAWLGVLVRRRRSH